MRPMKRNIMMRVKNHEHADNEIISENVANVENEEIMQMTKL